MMRRLRSMSNTQLLSWLIAFRLLNALLLWTHFTPDEFWQGPEVAHYIAFGQGHLTWEWLEDARIRGFTHPLVFAAWYKLLALLHLDSAWLIANSPKLLQAVLAALADWCTYDLARAIVKDSSSSSSSSSSNDSSSSNGSIGSSTSSSKSGSDSGSSSSTSSSCNSSATTISSSSGSGRLVRVKTVTVQSGHHASGAEWALLLQLTNWFNWYCMPRPYSNSMEAALTVAALWAWYPHWVVGASVHRAAKVRAEGGAEKGEEGGEGAWWRDVRSRNRHVAGLFLAALCVAIRPSSAGTMWVFVGLLVLLNMPLRDWLPYLSTLVLPVVGGVVSLSMVVDSWMYGEWWVCVPLNFLRFNVLQGQSAIFGVQPWHWNFTQGLPAILGGTLPVVLWALLRPPPVSRQPDRTRVLPASSSSSAAVAPATTLSSSSSSSPPLAASLLPPSTHRNPLVIIAWLIVFAMVTLSFSPHKEFRFLLPVLPLAHICAGYKIRWWLTHVGKSVDNNSGGSSEAAAAGGGNDGGADVGDDDGVNGSQCQPRKQRTMRGGRWPYVVVMVLVWINVPFGLYLGTVHQRGPLAALAMLRRHVRLLHEERWKERRELQLQCKGAPRGQQAKQEQRTHAHGRQQQEEVRVCRDGGSSTTGSGGGDLSVKGPGAISVHFLMPCHSTPFYSHQHLSHIPARRKARLEDDKFEVNDKIDIHLSFLECSPRQRSLPGGSPSDQFLADPLSFARQFTQERACTLPGARGQTKQCRKTKEEKDNKERREKRARAVTREQLPDFVMVYDVHLAQVMEGLHSQCMTRRGGGKGERRGDKGRSASAEEYCGGENSYCYEQVGSVFNTHFSGDADSLETYRRIVLLKLVLQ